MAPVESNGIAKKQQQVAIIFGVTGLVGRELAKRLLSKSLWKVYGIARKPERFAPQNTNFHIISCDLLDPFDAQKKLSFLEDVTHIFWVTWASQFPLDSRECCEQNRAMLLNALNAILPNAKALKHVSLQTGTKHYVSLRGPLISDAKQVFKEECPRSIGSSNFYHVLEDLLEERLKGKVGWSIQRPGLLTGLSDRTWFNFMGCLCVYGSICRHLNLPFVFGGTRECWEEPYIDISDARLVAEQHIWASTNGKISSPDGQAFNAINGRDFTWKELWPAIGSKFGLKQCIFSPDLLYSNVMADKGSIWGEIVAENVLLETEMEDLANWAFFDILFRCPLRLLASREKVDRLGFTYRYTALDSISYWIDTMRDQKVIP
ncbi:hypothetical protein Ancab_007399 [Ancistrocladus abbreviatus]